MSQQRQQIEVELGEESFGHCDCCGRASRTVQGYLQEVDGPSLAVYYVRWTDGHLDEVGADFELVIGAWGDGTSPADRAVVALRYYPDQDGPGSFMVVDAEPMPSLAAAALKRDEVIGTPLASQVFAMIDAAWEQDGRFF